MCPAGGVILLAEDEENDVLLVQRAFARGGLANPLFVVRDGDEAISYLSGIGKYADREEFPFPDLLLLDLKMPGVDGLGVLRWVRQQYAPRHSAGRGAHEFPRFARCQCCLPAGGRFIPG